MRQKEFFAVVALLLLAGAAIFSYRHFVMGFPLTPNQTANSWHVEAKLEIEGTNQPMRVDMYLPGVFNRYTLVDENYISNGFGLTSRRIKDTPNRVSSWAKRDPSNKEIIYYRGILYKTHLVGDHHDKPLKITVPQIGTPEFNDLANQDTSYFALKTLSEDIREKSADNETFALELMQFLSKFPDDSRAVQLRDANESLKSDAALAVYVMKYTGIAARVMNGVSLDKTSRQVPLQSWVQIYLDNHWLSYDMKLHSFSPLTDKLQWWAGSQPFFTVENGVNPVVRMSVKQHTESALTESMWGGDAQREAVYKLSIFGLPIDVQLVFAVLLPVPLGALVVCFMRQIVGVQTFGTFMPILVALAFRETQLIWGILFFCTITGLGLFFRSYLDRLQLLLVPRLTAIMILVVLCIYLLSVLTFNLKLHSGLSISLFPLVILTMLIERLSITCEEYGVGEALKSAAGSLIVAIISYGVMNNVIFSHLMVTFPELLMIVLAIVILIGRYNGYKITEYYRFRAFTKGFDNQPDTKA